MDRGRALDARLRFRDAAGARARYRSVRDRAAAGAQPGLIILDQ